MVDIAQLLVVVTARLKSVAIIADRTTRFARIFLSPGKQHCCV